MDLKEIVLTQDRGYELKDTHEPVEILGGNAQLGRVAKNNPADIEAAVRDSIERVYEHKVILPDGTNGYILHVKMFLGQVSDRVPSEQRETIVAFSAVRYRKR